LSSAEKTTDAPGRGVVHGDAAVVRVLHVAEPRRRVDHVDEREPP
jgi:hypothetical protein